MMKLKLLSALMLGGTLVACGGSSSGGGGGGGDLPDLPDEPEPTEGSQIEIENESMPLRENFSAVDAAAFFSTDYKPLNTPASNTITDEDGNEMELVDPRPSFYYPTCCFWAEDEETGEYLPNGELIPDVDDRMYVAENKMLVSNARFSIGQILSDLTNPEKYERKEETSQNAEGANPEDGSWGELDLSSPYRVSFCLHDKGRTGSGNSSLELYVDNNSGGNEAESFWGQDSVLLRYDLLADSTENFQALEPGNRIVLDVPGEVYMLDDEGNRTELNVNISPLDGESMPVGTETSYLQFRVSSGGYIVMSDFIVEYQDDEPLDYNNCPVDEDFYEAPALNGIPFQGIPADMPFTVDMADKTTDEFFGAAEEYTSFLAFADDRAVPFYKVVSGSSRTFIEEGNIRFGNAYWTIGHNGPETKASDSNAQGALDLSVDYTLRMDIIALQPTDEGALQINVDNNTSGSANSMHGEASRLFAATAAELETGTLVVNVPGDVTLNGNVIGTVADHVGTPTSFIMMRCPSNCGDADKAPENGITLGNIEIEYQGEAPGQDPDEIWSADSYLLVGEDQATGEVNSETETSLSLTASGGNVDSSNHGIFYAHQSEEISDFVFSARIASVAGADLAEGNGKRFGLMVMENLSAVGTYGELAAWADIGFYADDEKDDVPLEAVELIGSRGNMKPGGTRTRSDILDLEVGDHVRIEVYDDGENKRVRRCFSKDDGATWTSANSTTDFAADASTDSWYYGFYAAPGENEVTVEFDQVVFEEYTEDCDAGAVE